MVEKQTSEKELEAQLGSLSIQDTQEDLFEAMMSLNES